MTDVPIRRRRWLWPGLIAGLLGLGALVLWPFRSLNPEERHLVGTWQADVDGIPLTYTFTSDRRLSFLYGASSAPLEGTWSLSKSRLTVDYDSFDDPSEPWHTRITTFVKNVWTGFPKVKHWSIVFDSSDRMEVTFRDGRSHWFNRIHETPTADSRVTDSDSLAPTP